MHINGQYDWFTTLENINRDDTLSMMFACTHLGDLSSCIILFYQITIMTNNDYDLRLWSQNTRILHFGFVEKQTTDWKETDLVLVNGDTKHPNFVILSTVE